MSQREIGRHHDAMVLLDCMRGEEHLATSRELQEASVE